MITPDTVATLDAIYTQYHAGKLPWTDAIWHMRTTADLTGVDALELLTNPVRPSERYAEVSGGER